MANSSPTSRRYDIDWLRVAIILVVFIFHSGRFFDQGGWHVKNPTTYVTVQVWTAFLANWMMPFVFVISGASAYFALRPRSGNKFIRDRVLRLLVPLLVGIFSHIIWQVYLERLSQGGYRGSFLEFIPEYFKGWYGFGGNFAWMGLHLWYLEILFIFSMLLLPLFIWLKHGSGQKLLNAAHLALRKPGIIYCLAAPCMLLLANLDPGEPWGMREFGGWPLLVYLLYFVYGFIIVSHQPLEDLIRRSRWLSLGLAVVGTVGLLAMYLLNVATDFGNPGFDLFSSLFALCSWCYILAIWGFGTRTLTQNHPKLTSLNEAVLPFYILHQTILLGVGYFIVRWPVPDLLKFFIIAVSSFALIIGIYLLAIRPYKIIRFLFGMKT
jgi:peptidoglycan/LPS O-acetylase OafA/YrhL